MKGAARTILLFLSGHLCCLAGFEWSRLWAYFPGHFRWGATFVVTLGFYLSLECLLERQRKVSVSAVQLMAWSASTGYILWLYSWERALAVVIWGLLLSASTLEGGRRLTAFLVSSLLAAAAYFNLPPAAVGLALFLAYLLEARHLTISDLNLGALEAMKDKLPGEALAEISWRGFAQLYSSCEKGEGEKFSRRVLTDTVAVVNSCGGKLQSGSEHRGVYLFPNYAARRECQKVLLEYQEQLDGVLESVNAPVVRVFFREL